MSTISRGLPTSNSWIHALVNSTRLTYDSANHLSPLTDVNYCDSTNHMSLKPFPAYGTTCVMICVYFFFVTCCAIIPTRPSDIFITMVIYC